MNHTTNFYQNTERGLANPIQNVTSQIISNPQIPRTANKIHQAEVTRNRVRLNYLIKKLNRNISKKAQDQATLTKQLETTTETAETTANSLNLILSRLNETTESTPGLFQHVLSSKAYFGNRTENQITELNTTTVRNTYVSRSFNEMHSYFNESYENSLNIFNTALKDHNSNDIQIALVVIVLFTILLISMSLLAINQRQKIKEAYNEFIKMNLGSGSFFSKSGFVQIAQDSDTEEMIDNEDEFDKLFENFHLSSFVKD